MRAFGRALALTVIYLAAAAMADWSLFVVAHDVYGVPRPLAALVAAVFDGAALACLSFASEAVREARSAAGPRAATVALAAVSVFLNVVHARHIHGGLPAALLFAAPTVALLVVSDLTWATTRAHVRAERGERPLALPVFGAWGWLLARPQAWQATRDRAAAHVTGHSSAQPQAAGRHTATEVLRARFAEMDPAEAIRIAHEAQPALPPADLAALLVTYGVIVDVVQVALVLGHRTPAVQVERGEGAVTPVTPGRDAVTAPVTPAVTAALDPAPERPAEHPTVTDVTDTDTQVTAPELPPAALVEIATAANVPVPVPGETLTDAQLIVVLMYLCFQDEPPLSYRQAVAAFREAGYVGSEERVRKTWRHMAGDESTIPAAR